MAHIVHLPTSLVTRYQVVDRELVGAPEDVVDTPSHLDELERDIAAHGIREPLDLGFNERFATLDGHHRLAVARRLALETVPVALRRLPLEPRPWWAQDMDPLDYRLLDAVDPR
ncbi:MAG: ParB N-terminal domain-containing protein [Acidipropionibacterium sp.]|nr:ParB N-terminal domain-containing protein [Acidipropionibacterium sp.]